MGRRAFALLVASSLLLCACGLKDETGPGPSDGLVDRIEHALAGKPCIGPLENWARYYSFPMKPGGQSVDRSVVYFLFREAGRFGYKAGRYIETERRFEVDDRQFKLALGQYEIESGKLEIEFCGPNLHDGPVEADGIIDANTGQIISESK